MGHSELYIKWKIYKWGWCCIILLVCYCLMDSYLISLLNTLKHCLSTLQTFLLFSLLQMFIFLDSKGLSCVLNNLRTVKPHLLLTVFPSSFDELSIVPFLFLSMPSKDRAGGEDVAGGVMSSELNHSRLLRYWHVQCPFENPYYGVRV